MPTQIKLHSGSINQFKDVSQGDFFRYEDELFYMAKKEPISILVGAKAFFDPEDIIQIVREAHFYF